MPTSEEKPVPPEHKYYCHTCMSPRLVFYVWESSDEAHEDYHYRCLDCGHEWWVEGIDS